MLLNRKKSIDSSLIESFLDSGKSHQSGDSRKIESRKDGSFAPVSSRSGKDRRKYRAVWVSDIHLGTRGCNAGELLNFLRDVDCDQLYLVGDIVDGWRLKRSWYWPQLHNDVVQKVLRKARAGTKVIYIPGNHDEFLMQYIGNNFGGIDIVENAIHECADGRRLLVLHGHEFDNIVRYSRWLAFVGDYAYQAAQALNYMFNLTRRYFGMNYWSLSSYLKNKVKNAVNFIASFEEAVSGAAAHYKADGVVCGHIHHAQMREIKGVEYYNDGDWVESCTALVEDHEGGFHLIDWFGDEKLPADLLPNTAKNVTPVSAIRRVVNTVQETV